ncbi:iron-sulfur cluster assembly scaffold protein [Aliiroseovarius lamellibrachiae]|uniref:iron-sulfur cluster assembly scaffold protein n=1 Tax=Aliiroseovarius lamellibrachiae TaxID=1924933 RepID=UPI001BDFD783|nr:iron-sulfur cluster assembly scaffold protein [Aliiroseovarius lamellibrachiae]MBT2132096.1 iron-sulfur cluster assembly scaffold protein [Aliiroseovarius lamellibrachiae]
MSDSDLIKLYSKKILGLASQIPHLQPLSAPDGEAKVRAPLCGSTVSASVVLDDGKISQYSQNVKACALGQASAAILGKSVIGLTRADLQSGRDQLSAMLKSTGPTPSAPFEAYEILSPAREYKNRHASILLAFDAALAAIDAVDAA